MASLWIPSPRIFQGTISEPHINGGPWHEIRGQTISMGGTGRKQGVRKGAMVGKRLRSTSPENYNQGHPQSDEGQRLYTPNSIP